jgi:hypothetical protein
VIHRLTTEILSPAGSYRQKYKNTGTRSGYRVKVYRLTTIFQGVRSAFSSSKHPVGRTSSVKKKNRVRWWAHPLFGTPDERPPPGLRRKVAAEMRSLDELGKGRGWRVDRPGTLTP